ncbi:MAG: N-acetylmuramoyl-L-alanine amidase [Alphaproteobacteria bacterium]
MRIGAHPSATRVVLDLSERVRYRIFTLCRPARVVIELPAVGWRLSTGAPIKGHGLVRALRFGTPSPGRSRVVLDVADTARIARTFMLRPQGSVGRHRLVVDLKSAPGDRTNCAAAAPPPGAKRAARGARPTPPPSRKAGLARPPSRQVRPTPPAARNGVRRQSRPRRRSRIVIAIDPGHGGIDPGTVGVRGSKEKTITLAVALELKRQLEASGRYKVVLTRQGDTFVRLRDRISRARRAGAKLFISLHADSIRNRATRGGSVYTLSERASDVEASALAAKENRADAIAGVDLSRQSDDVADILIDLAQRETMNLSAKFANILVRTLAPEIRLLRNTHRFAGFTVLKAPDVPSVLFELGYLSNRVDELLLRRRSYRVKLAARVVKAVDRFFAHTDRLSRS